MQSQNLDLLLYVPPSYTCDSMVEKIVQVEIDFVWGKENCVYYLR